MEGQWPHWQGQARPVGILWGQHRTLVSIYSLPGPVLGVARAKTVSAPNLLSEERDAQENGQPPCSVICVTKDVSPGIRMALEQEGQTRKPRWGQYLERSLFRQRKCQVRRPGGAGVHEHAVNCCLQSPVWPASAYPSSPSWLIMCLSIIRTFFSCLSFYLCLSGALFLLSSSGLFKLTL